MNRGILLGLWLLGAVSSSFGQESSGCAKSVASFFDVSETPPSTLLRFPKGLKEPGQELQFGFEAEYVLAESAPLMKVYGPDPARYPSLPWDSWSELQRLEWVQAHVDELFPNLREAGGLVLRSQDPELSFLPKHLIRDSTGNLEIVLDPESVWLKYNAQLEKLNELFGPGSMQATMSSTKEAFFRKSATEWMGILNWMQESDTLDKLRVGLQRWRKDTSKSVALSFQHPFLGPMNLRKQKKLQETLVSHAAFPEFKKSSAAWVSTEDSSFKYVGGTAYRPDLVDHRIILEVRDCHTNWACLQSRLNRLLSLFENDLSKPDWAGLQAFDSERDFEKLSPDVQDFLRDLFPAKTKVGESYTPDEVLSLEVFRNFAYPLRDWSGFPGLRSDLLEVAQGSYKNKLLKLQKDFRAGRLSKDQAARAVQGALVEFIDDAGLASMTLGQAWKPRQEVFAA